MTKVDTSLSRYRERDDAKDEFNRHELRRCRQLLRRLQYLEAQVRDRGGLADPTGNGGAAFAEFEVECLEWVLTEIEFLETIGE
jgi:hypothetical protein